MYIKERYLKHIICIGNHIKIIGNQEREITEESQKIRELSVITHRVHQPRSQQTEQKAKIGSKLTYREQELFTNFL